MQCAEHVALAQQDDVRNGETRTKSVRLARASALSPEAFSFCSRSIGDEISLLRGAPLAARRPPACPSSAAATRAANAPSSPPTRPLAPAAVSRLLSPLSLSNFPPSPHAQLLPLVDIMQANLTSLVRRARIPQEPTALVFTSDGGVRAAQDGDDEDRVIEIKTSHDMLPVPEDSPLRASSRPSRRPARPPPRCETDRRALSLDRIPSLPLLCQVHGAL